MAFSARVVDPGGSREESFRFAKGQLLLVQAKRLSLGQTFIESVPEVVSQAITVLKCAKYVGTTCSTSSIPLAAFPRSVSVYLMGRNGVFFFILKSENNTLTFYESGMCCLSRESDLPLREIVQLICEWVSFSINLLIYFSRTYFFS
jgi:hypothetical protein